jgi:hypothetical protein
LDYYIDNSQDKTPPLQQQQHSHHQVSFIYALVHYFNNRWRWCCGSFNFR